jgi:putative addiction module component (TIGR02574 family)
VELAKDALELPSHQRIALARILLDVSDAGRDFSPEAENAWEEEICRRMQAVEAGTVQAGSPEEVFQV